MDQTDLLFGGPGPPPQPWYGIGGGAAIAYDGSIVTPGNVPGGPQGAGTINANDIYIKGVRLEFLIQGFLPLTGGTLTGLLVISGPNNLQIGLGQAGQILASDGNNNTYWTNVPPGGPYLLASGGTLTGPLTLVDNTYLLIGGGAAGQVLQTDGNSNLTWVNPGGAGSLPPAGTATPGQLLATDGGTAPYWTSTLPGGPYAPATGGSYLPLAGGTLTGPLIQAADPIAALGTVTKQYSDANTSNKLPLAGGTLTGPLIQAADPVNPLGSATKQYVDNHLGMRNRLINGAFVIDQRNVGVGSSINAYGPDRWYAAGSLTGKFSTIAQWTGSSIPGFLYGMIFTSAATAYTLLATDYFELYQAIEANNFGDCAWGTASAKAASLSFWVFSNFAGLYGGSINNYAGTRSYTFSYNIPTANTWTYVTIPIPGDTAGTWVLSGNAGACYVIFSLGAGSNFTTAANVWTTGNFSSPPGCVSLPAHVSTSIVFTGVQFEFSPTATPFERRSYGTELALCQRYYEKSYDVTTALGAVNINGQAFLYMVLGVTAVTTPSAGNSIQFKTTKRTAPTMTAYNPQTGAVGTGYDANSAVSSTVNFQGAGMSGFGWYTTVGATSGSVNYRMHWTASSDI